MSVLTLGILCFWSKTNSKKKKTQTKTKNFSTKNTAM